MAVAKVGSTGVFIAFNQTNYTSASYALDAGANYLTFRIAYANSSALTGLTWDSGGSPQTPTLLGSLIEDGDGHRAAIYGLATPTTGSRTFNITFASNNGFVIAVDGWSGVDVGGTPTAGFGSSTATSQASPSSVSTTASAVSGDLTIDLISWAASGAALTDDASPSVSDFNDVEGTIGYASGAGSNTTTTGTVTCQWTYTGNVTRAMACVILKASSGGGGGNAVAWLRA